MSLFDEVDNLSSTVIMAYCDVSGAGLRAMLASSLCISSTDCSRIEQHNISIPLATSNFTEYPFDTLRTVYEGHELMRVTNYIYSKKVSSEVACDQDQNHVDIRRPILTCITLNSVIPEDLSIDLAQQIIAELSTRGVKSIQVLCSQALKGAPLPASQMNNQEKETEQVYIASNASDSEIEEIDSLPFEIEYKETSLNGNILKCDSLSNTVFDLFPRLDGATKLYDPFICALITIARISKMKIIVFTCYGYKMRSNYPEEDETNSAIKALGNVIERVTKNILHFDYQAVAKLKSMIPIRTLFANEVTIDSFFDVKPSKEHCDWVRNDGFRTHL